MLDIGVIVLFLISLSFLLFCPPLCHPWSPSYLTQAALMGGTTMVMALVLPEQHCSLLDAYEKCRALADAKACCDYALHVGLTWWGPKVNLKKRTTKEFGITLVAYIIIYFCALLAFIIVE